MFQVSEENPHLVIGQVAVARKMGFPEVILPGDVRNDLYLTIIGGEFSKGSKSTDKNVEVTVKVCSEKGTPIPVCIFSVMCVSVFLVYLKAQIVCFVIIIDKTFLSFYGIKFGCLLTKPFDVLDLLNFC